MVRVMGTGGRGGWGMDEGTDGVAADCPADPGSDGFCVCGCVSLACPAFVADACGQPFACAAWALAAGVCGWVCAEECGADDDGSVWVHAESALPGVDVDCVRV